MGTDIVVGIDGSENSEIALRWALDEAETHGARVRAVLTWTHLGQGGSGFGPLTTEADAQRVLDDTVARVAGERNGLVTTVVVNDLPVRALLEQAEQGAMLVVGSRGIGGIKGMLMGSVSRTVVERSKVPVVVVPQADPA